jgi:hypothetical protein
MRGGGPPLSVGPAGRVEPLRGVLCKSEGLPHERSSAGDGVAIIPRCVVSMVSQELRQEWGAPIYRGWRRADPGALGPRRLDLAGPGRSRLPHAARAVAERTATGTPRTANENLVTRTVCPCKRQAPSSLLVNLVKDVPHYVRTGGKSGVAAGGSDGERLKTPRFMRLFADRTAETRVRIGIIALYPKEAPGVGERRRGALEAMQLCATKTAQFRRQVVGAIRANKAPTE